MWNDGKSGSCIAQELSHKSLIGRRRMTSHHSVHMSMQCHVSMERFGKDGRAATTASTTK